MTDGGVVTDGGDGCGVVYAAKTMQSDMIFFSLTTPKQRFPICGLVHEISAAFDPSKTHVLQLNGERPRSDQMAKGIVAFVNSW